MEDNIMNESDAMEAEVVDTAEKQDSKKRIVGIGVAILALVLLCCVILGAVLALDPFGWGLLGRLTGKYDPIAQAMPEDTSVYVGFNLLNTTPEKITRLTAPFEDAIEDVSGEEVGSYDKVIAEIDDLLAEDTNLTVEEDFLSWIGQYAGMGITNIKIDEYYGEFEDANVILAVEVRDRKAADAFIQKLQVEVTDDTGNDFRTEEYKGVEIFELDATDEADQVAFARSGGVFLLGSDAEMIKSAMDAQKGASLGDSQIYKDLMNDLPKDRSLTFYMPGEQLIESYSAILASSMIEMGDSASSVYDSIKGIAFSTAITDEGLQLDSVISYDLNILSEANQEVLKKARSQGNTSALFPKDTVLYITAARLDLIWKASRETLAESVGKEDYDEMMKALEDELGFNVETDLIPYLDGEYAFGIIPSSKGLIASYSEVNLGIGMVFETSDDEKILNITPDFVNMLENSSLIVEDVSTEDIAVYQAGDEYMDETIFSFGVGNDLLGFATSTYDLKAFYDNEASLSNNEAYKNIWKAFPNDISPSLYFDVKALMGIIREGLSEYELEYFEETASVFDPIQYIVGGSVVKKDMAHSIVIVFLP